MLRQVIKGNKLESGKDFNSVKATVTQEGGTRWASPMAAKEGKQWWDPYETSHRKHFVYRPNSAAEMLLRPVSTSVIDSHSRSGPFGSTVYNKDFSWRPACKAECIRTGTASGHRRNNPHPSQAFLMWRLPMDAARGSQYVALPWKCFPSDDEIHKAFMAQYRSTYRCDFLGSPQGDDNVNKTGSRAAKLQTRRHIVTSFPTETEMKASYRGTKQKPELQNNLLQYSGSTGRTTLCPGIVPTVVQRHVHTQQKESDLTTYDRFCGKRVSDVTSVMKSLPPEELQQLHRLLPEEEKKAVKIILSKDVGPTTKGKLEKLPAVACGSRSPERISAWPGPL